MRLAGLQLGAMSPVRGRMTWVHPTAAPLRRLWTRNQSSTPAATRGARALKLLLDQSSWTHRRVETISFLANGETRRSISWDVTIPPELAIMASDDRVAVPLAVLRKGPLKNLDVRDAGGLALPIWGTRDNGELAVELLSSGLAGLRGRAVTERQQSAIRSVVFDSGHGEVAAELETIRGGATHPPSPDAAIAVAALAETLATSFVFVVELPREAIGTRTIVKAAYEDERSGSRWSSVGAEVAVDLEADGWGYAQSWHLEVHAPEGLRVQSLEFETSDTDTETVTAARSDRDGGGTAHIAVADVSPHDAYWCQVRFSPEPSTLLNPLTTGAALSTLLLWGSVVFAEQIAQRLVELNGNGGSLGALIFGLPAFFFALLSRSAEHELASQVLLGPRLVSLGSALCLWAAGGVVVWAPPAPELSISFSVLALLQTFMLGWLARMRPVGAEG